MKIYTSYFSNGAKLAKAGIMMIGIALYPPKWFTGLSNKYVSPSWDILHNSKSKEDYVQRFNSEILAHRDPKAFFVKPRYGSDSFGISEKSICRTPKEVMEQVKYLKEEFGMESIVEEYIAGSDCTVTCINNHKYLLLCSISIDCDETNGIQTRDCKVGFKECCSAMNDDRLMNLAGTIFLYLGLKSHARIDFRKGIDGRYYPIDINLLPGLGPLDHLSKSLLLCKNMSYIDALKAVIASAS